MEKPSENTKRKIETWLILEGCNYLRIDIDGEPIGRHEKSLKDVSILTGPRVTRNIGSHVLVYLVHRPILIPIFKSTIPISLSYKRLKIQDHIYDTPCDPSAN